MIQATDNLNSLQKNGILLAVKQQKINATRTTRKFETEIIKSSLCDYSDAFTLVIGDITVMQKIIQTLHLKIVHHFVRVKKIKDMFIDEANHINVAMPMYNLIEYGDNCLGTSGSLWQFKRDEVPNNNDDLAILNSRSFKYKAALVGKTPDAVNNTNSSVKNTKIVVPLKYLSNIWRSLEMLLINCKVHLELYWIEKFILSSAGNSSKFNITDAKLHVPILTLSTKDNVNLTK